MENLKKYTHTQYTYTMCILGFFGETFEKQHKIQKNSGTASK